MTIMLIFHILDEKTYPMDNLVSLSGDRLVIQILKEGFLLINFPFIKINSHM